MYEFQVYRKDAITDVQTKPHSSINPKIVSGVFKGFLVRASREMTLKELLLRSVTNIMQQRENHRQYKKRNQLSSSLGFQVYL